MTPHPPTAPLQSLRDVPAPAKLNLFLHITGRRADGYHLLQSVFMLIDWCDRLHFELRPDGQISREDLSGGHLPVDDLCTQAARALQAATGSALGVHIGLDKRLPAEAGLGGGSSDAASCLLALNRLWGLGLRRQQLADIGLTLGADVPFFVSGRNAWVEGVGERITPVSLTPARWVVVKPPVGASTPRIFSDPALKRDTKTATIQGFAANERADQLSEVLRCDVQQLLDAGHNDLQPVVQRLCPEVSDCLRWLQGQGLQGRMTGSGTAVFAQMPQAFELASAPSHWRVQVCSSMDAHPLLDWCAD